MNINLRMKVACILSFTVFAILLNTVGAVILQVISDYGVTKPEAATLEIAKDVSIAVCSFIIGSFLPLFGYRKSMLLGLIVVCISCVFMASIGGFLMAQIFFALLGFSFALVKISVYSSISLITSTSEEHASTMSIIEGFFMVGIVTGQWLFAYFIGLENIYNDTTLWLGVYWVIAFLSFIAFIMVLTTKLDESQVKKENSTARENFLTMLSLITYSLVIAFVVGLFFYVFLEQSLNTWLPTFNSEVLHLPETISVQVASLLPASSAIGRLIGGYVMKKVHWRWVLCVCLSMAIVLILTILPLANIVADQVNQGWHNIPLAAWLLPLVGLFIAPIYPTLISVSLNALPKSWQSGATSLIVIFSSLGGVSGSYITGWIFEYMDGIIAFYITSIIPCIMLLLLIFPYYRLGTRFKQKMNPRQ